MDDPTKDTIPRSAVEYYLRKETVNTNPEAYESHERFIAYMNDPDISQFGHWMHSNGFNCALVSIAVDLEKIPSVTPSAQPRWIPCTPETMPEREGRYVCTYTYDGKKDVFMFRFEDGDFLVPWYVDAITAWYKPLDPWEGDKHGKT